jgi:hypothetical protein
MNTQTTNLAYNPTDIAQLDAHYTLAYKATDYTFPTDALIHTIHLSDDYLRVELTDGRNLEIPLWWIPSLHNAEPTDRQRYVITRDRKTIFWDPAQGPINEIVQIDDYLISPAMLRFVREHSQRLLSE